MLLAELRAQTRDLHEQIEKDMPLLRDDFSQGQYSELLGRFWGFLRPLEPLIYPRAEWLSLPGDWAARFNFNRVAALEADLRYLGLPNQLAESFPLCHYLPDVEEFARSLGGAYVLEGSTLGGQVLARHLREKFGLEIGRGATYFSAYGAQTGTRWKEFCAALDAFETSLNVELSEAQRDAQKAMAIQAARDTFACLGKWLRDESHART